MLYQKRIQVVPKTYSFISNLIFRILKHNSLRFGTALYNEENEKTFFKTIKNKTMKMQSNRLLSPLSEHSVINLTTEVKEVLETGFKKVPNRILSVADMWNIQRQRKTRSLRRYI